MSFISPVFFLFFPCTLLFYRLTPQNFRWIVLLFSSYFFYAYYNVWLLSLILLTTLVSYLCAICIETAKNNAQRRFYIALDIIVCLGILFLFKYFNFALGSLFALCRLFGMQVSLPKFNLLLPMGISFYVFQTMSYTIDVYRGTICAERHLGYYSLFVVFFPQLVAGPIERPGDLLPQLKSPKHCSISDVFEGVRYLIRGYAKKILIADYFAHFVDATYRNVNSVGGAALAVATALFAIQIYCDFSGYSDIALGCARFLGIHLSENFHNPYSAVSIRDFWKRWHISLTRWFTDYLYIPLGGNRKGFGRQCLNIMIVFLVSGLWHGANLTFLVWGGLHGIFLIIENYFFKTKKVSTIKKLPHKIITLLLVWFAWIFFRSSTLSEATTIIHAIFTNFNVTQVFSDLSMNHTQLLLTFVMIYMLPALDRLPPIYVPQTTLSKAHSQCHTALLYFLLIISILICRCLVLSQHGAASFIYFQF